MHEDSKKHETPADANNVLANVFTSVISLKFFVAIQRVIGEFNLKMETYCSLGENDVEVKIRYADFSELEKLNQRAKGYSVSERKVDDV
jgi:type II secretory pathway component PulL